MSVVELSLRPDEPVGIVTLQRPPINALTPGMIRQLVQVLANVESQTAVRALVIRGGIRNAFCSGGDLGDLFGHEMRASHQLERLSLLSDMQRCFKWIEAYPKPIVAAINGIAIGAGVELALVCDFRVASELAYFGLPELAHGLIPGLGGTLRLARTIGVARAKEMMMIGRRIRAEDALSWGLVHRVEKAQDTVRGAIELARELGNKPADALAALKRSIYRGVYTGPGEALDQETSEFAELLARRFESTPVEDR